MQIKMQNDIITINQNHNEVRMSILEEEKNENDKINNIYHNNDFDMKYLLSLNDNLQETCIDFYKIIKFRNQYLYLRSRELSSIIEKYHIDMALIQAIDEKNNNSSSIRINFARKENKEIDKEIVLNEFKKLHYFDEIIIKQEGKNTFYYILHSSDIKKQIDYFYNRNGEIDYPLKEEK